MNTSALREGLKKVGYIPDESLSTALWLSTVLERPLLLEGDAGVGKTSIAGAFAKMRSCQLIRLQCYEGLDLQQAAYEWNYSRQLLEIRMHETGLAGNNENFNLLQRPLLQAISTTQPSVLLIDEIDRADDAFEAYLLEVLADFQISIPELGTVKATSIPQVILTSNGTRELSDALRRRCLYHFVDYPSIAREIEIVKSTLPEAASRLIESAVEFVQKLRKEDLQKTPGVSETLDWIRALHQLKLPDLPDDPQLILATLSCLLKTKNDHWQMTPETVTRLLGGERTGVMVGAAAGLSRV
jgi:MoxR-like ATPase